MGSSRLDFAERGTDPACQIARKGTTELPVQRRGRRSPLDETCPTNLRILQVDVSVSREPESHMVFPADCGPHLVDVKKPPGFIPLRASDLSELQSGTEFPPGETSSTHRACPCLLRAHHALGVLLGRETEA